MEQRKYAEALMRYQEALGLSPTDPSIPFNAGLAAFLSGNYAVAADLWERLKAVDPDDWRARPKLVQAYQAMGKLVERDAERAELIALWRSSKIEDLARQVLYCREQFEMNGRRIMVFEHFELKGQRAVRYVFSVLKQDKAEEEFRISLGSYEFTNLHWRERTRGTPKEGERLFHLDGYFLKGAHVTYGMFVGEPSYDDTRAMVINILDGKNSPISSSTWFPGAAPQTPKP